MAFTKEFELNAKTNAKDVQQEFTDLRNGIKETTEAIEGLDKSSKTYEKDLKTLNSELDNMQQAQKELKKSNTDLGASFEDVHGEILPLTGQMGEMEDRLYQMALAGDTASKEYKDLLAEVGKYRKVQIDTDLAVDAAAGTMSQKLGGALQGAAGGFALVQGSMALFGSESEAVEEAMLKVQSAMAISQGVQGLREGAKAMKALTAATNLQNIASKAMTVATYAQAAAQKVLNLAMAANPIGLIIAGVTTLIGLFGAWFVGIEKLKDGLMAVTDWLGITDSEAEEMANKREQEAERQRMLQEAEQKRQERLHNTKMNDLDNEIALARAQGKDTTKLQKKKIQEIIKVKKAKLEELAVDEAILEQQKQILIGIQARGGAAGAAAGGVLKALEKRQEESEALKNEISKLQNDLKIVDIEFEKARKSKRSSSSSSSTKKDADKEASDKLKRDAKLEKDRLDNLKKLREEALAELEAEDEARYQKLIGEQQTEINVVNDKYFRLIELAKQYGEDTTLLEESQQQQIAEIQAKYRLEKEAKDKESADKIKAQSDKQINDSREEWNTKLSLASDSLGAINDLVQVFAGEGEEAQKRAFEVNKAISISQAVVSTAQGIMGQLAVPQDALTGANFVKAGIVAATGVTQIAKISQTKFQGGSTGGSSDVPSGNVGGQAPQFNVVGDSGISQLADISSSPTQAYVVSGEVTTAQSLDRNRIKNATI